jgi:predicted acylesterase/phospholipase RssA
MLVIQQSPRRTKTHRKARVGIAVAGGGPIGGMYELGTLRALDEALEGVDLTRLDVYVGVSSGAILASSLANGISPEEMCRIFLGFEPGGVRFRPETFLRPAFREYAKRVATLPRIVWSWMYDLATRPLETDWLGLIGRLSAVVPNGIFDNDAVERFLREVFETHGRGNDFRRLDRKLYVIAVALDTGSVVKFGEPGRDHVPISRAVQASAALPGLYPPVEIDGAHYVDGALRRTLHASVAMDEGVDLVIGLNPLVPFDASLGPSSGAVAGSLIDTGLPTVLSQTFRTLLKSRMQVGLEKYRTQYPDTDLVLFEPNADDAEMFFTNIFSYHSRTQLTEHAYRATLEDLRRRRAELEPILARHGIRLRDEILDERTRTVATGLGQRPPRMTRPTAQLRRALDDLAHLLDLQDTDVGAQPGAATSVISVGPKPRHGTRQKRRSTNPS